jgi:hypothetical protein
MIQMGLNSDVSLYRTAMGDLKTDNTLRVGGTVLAGPSQLDLLAELQKYRGADASVTVVYIAYALKTCSFLRQRRCSWGRRAISAALAKPSPSCWARCSRRLSPFRLSAARI